MIKRVEKTWGTEEWLVNTELYCLKRMLLKRGGVCSVHMHPNKTETFYMHSGKMAIQVGVNSTFLHQGESITIPSRTWHRFAGIHNCVFSEVSTFHDDEDVARRTKSAFLASFHGMDDSTADNLFAAIDERLVRRLE